MSGLGRCELSPAAVSLEREACRHAASRGDTAYGSTHLLAAMLDGASAVSQVLASVLPAEGRAALARPQGTVRIPVGAVRPASDLTIVYSAANDVARRHGRTTIAPRDLLEALAVVPGPHSGIFATTELEILAGLSSLDEGRPLEAAARPVAARRFFSGMHGLLATFSAGAALVFFGAGVVLHRAFVHVAAGLQHRTVHFPVWWVNLEGRFEPTANLTLRQYLRCTVVVRSALFLLSAALFLALALEIRGLGVVPFPSLTNRAVRLTGDDLDGQLGAQVFLGRHPLGVWLAAGAGFLAVPARDEIERVAAWTRLRGRPRRSVRVLLAPALLLSRTLTKVDRTATWLAAPAVVAAGMLGTLAAAISGFGAAALLLNLV